MGEIKSTLDIIMEKAQDFTVTEEEKKAFQKKEVEVKVRGFLQKYLDGLMEIESFKQEMGAFGGNQQEMAREALKRECLDRIDPEADNARLLKLLDHLDDKNTLHLLEILSEFQKDLEKERAVREKAVRERLRRAGVSGKAVIPNIEGDLEWIRYKSERRESFYEKLDLIKNK